MDISFVNGSLSFQSCDQATLERILSASNSVLSETDIGNGLKQALDKGVDKGVQYLGKSGGFTNTAYKILLPDEAEKVVDKLRFIPGFDELEANIIQKVNKSAEDAVKKATPIFVSAIKQMTIQDATNILLGQNNAATAYLNRTTYSSLYKEFDPVVVNSLNKFGALDLWTDAVTNYNTLPFVKKVNPKLEDYVVTKTLTALFDRIAIEELNIRENLGARTTDLLRRVFAKQDNK